MDIVILFRVRFPATINRSEVCESLLLSLTWKCRAVVVLETKLMASHLAQGTF